MTAAAELLTPTATFKWWKYQTQAVPASSDGTRLSGSELKLCWTQTQSELSTAAIVIQRHGEGMSSFKYRLFYIVSPPEQQTRVEGQSWGWSVSIVKRDFALFMNYTTKLSCNDRHQTFFWTRQSVFVFNWVEKHWNSKVKHFLTMITMDLLYSAVCIKFEFLPSSKIIVISELCKNYSNRAMKVILLYPLREIVSLSENLSWFWSLCNNCLHLAYRFIKNLDEKVSPNVN